MMFKHLDARVVQVWDGLRPMTKKMLERLLEPNGPLLPSSTLQKFHYDAHADWELSQLLTALDAQMKAKDAVGADEAAQLAETCVKILEAQCGSAEVFIQLAQRALKQHDYDRFEKLAEHLLERFSAGEIAEIIRQTDLPQIRAIAYETLVLFPAQSMLPLLDDPLYADIAMQVLEQKAFEFESEEARDLLEQIEMENGFPI